MKATARAHPIQGLIKYHGMRDPTLRLPYHDSISVCTKPSSSITTAEFDPGRSENTYIIDGNVVEGRPAERISAVVDHVRDLATIEAPVKLQSENNFPTNIGFGSSSSGFAAAALALARAANLELSHEEISAIARRGSSSAARAVTGGFSHLRTGLDDVDCRSERIITPLEDELQIIAAEIPAYKQTEEAHREAADSHMFESRMAHMHGQIAKMRHALRVADFDRAFELAEHDSLSLAATTMTGPAGWVYWKPETIEVFEMVRTLRQDGISAYYSTDTGASVYINTTKENVGIVQDRLADLDIPSKTWSVGGEATVLDPDQALF